MSPRFVNVINPEPHSVQRITSNFILTTHLCCSGLTLLFTLKSWPKYVFQSFDEEKKDICGLTTYLYIRASINRTSYKFQLNKFKFEIVAKNPDKSTSARLLKYELWISRPPKSQIETNTLSAQSLSPFTISFLVPTIQISLLMIVSKRPLRLTSQGKIDRLFEKKIAYSPQLKTSFQKLPKLTIRRYASAPKNFFNKMPSNRGYKRKENHTFYSVVCPCLFVAHLYK